MILVNHLVKFTYTDSELILRCDIYNTFLMLLILIIFIIMSMFFFTLVLKILLYSVILIFSYICHIFYIDIYC